jgi:phosphoribosylformimino-5-aminoimidazole carboxamide ribotide isomerase
MRCMRIIPVLDLLRGQIVHAIAGRRHEYRPIRSTLTPSTGPLAVAEAFRDHFGLTTLYLADLDAIAGSPPSLTTYIALNNRGFGLLIDAGLRTAADAQPLCDAGLAAVVAGLETLAGPEALALLVKTVGAEHLIFSLDLKDGQPLVAAQWPVRDAAGLTGFAIEQGVRRLLVLDLARVGTGSGTGTEDFCQQIKQAWPEVEVLAGGGVRGREDLDRLRGRGVDGVLVASALHDGRLLREDLG